MTAPKIWITICSQACMLKQQENRKMGMGRSMKKFTLRSQQTKSHFKTHAYSVQNGTDRKFSSAFMALTKMDDDNSH
ncbi:hypothetical protein HKD37_07G018231 [Glycine soja]